MGGGGDGLEGPYTAGGGGVTPLDPLPLPLPFQCLRLTAKISASAPSVPRGLRLKDFWPAFGGGHGGTLGGGGVPAKPPLPLPFRPPLRPF